MDKDIIKEIFEKSKSTKSLIGIWTYTDGDGFWSGYVTDYNDDFVQIQHFTKYGKSDGTIIEQIVNIESIDFEDDYAKCLKYLIENNNELDNEVELLQTLPEGENWQYNYLKHHIGKTNRLVRITVKEEITYSGFIHKLNKENVVLHLLGKLGEDQGFSMFKLNDVTCVRVNDIENRKRLMLHNWKKRIGL